MLSRPVQFGVLPGASIALAGLASMTARANAASSVSEVGGGQAGGKDTRAEPPVGRVPIAHNAG